MSSRLFFLGRGEGPPQRPPAWLWALLLGVGCGMAEAPAKSVDTGPFVSEEGYEGPCDPNHDGDGWSVEEGDCDCSNADVHPGNTEICNGIDDNCDGAVDEGVQTTYYVDFDGDGFGDVTQTAIACEAPRGYVQNATDCDDTRADVSPAASDPCDGLDNDCNGTVDDGCADTGAP